MALTTTSLGKVRYNVRGEYSTSGTYTIDDIVSYVGAQYICRGNNSSGAQIPGIASISFWEKISGLTRDRAEWSSATAYQANDVVTVTVEYAYNSVFKYYDKEVYICKTANSNSNPRTSSLWAKLSSGSSYSRTAFLGAVNDGFSPPYKPIWNARSQAVIGTINTVYITNAGSNVSVFNTILGRRGSPKSGMLKLIATNGGGSGFEGVAHINPSGVCFQCDIVNPGQNYTSNPTIAIDTSTSGYVGLAGGGTLPTFAAYATTNSTNGATGTSALVGMGDSIGPCKTPGTHDNGFNQWSYINRRGSFVNFGGNWNLSGCVPYSGNSRADGQNGAQVIDEGNFVNLDYLDGVLATPDGEYPKVIQVERGKQNTTVLFNNGEVHYCGYNGNGQAGTNYTETDQYGASRCGYGNINKSGTTVLRGKKAIRIACSHGGDNNESHSIHALIENTNGTRELWSWGYNGYGQLGLSDTTQRTIPVQVAFNQAVNGRIVEIWATGGNYGQIFVLTDQGKLYGCGYNGYGNLGNGNSTNQSTLVQVDNNSFGVLTGSGGKIKKFSINGASTPGNYALLKGDGSVYTWGYNGYGQNGHNHTFNTYIPVRLYTGGYSSAANPITSIGNQGTPSGTAIADAQDVWVCGGNAYQYLMVTRGSSIINNTLFACGYNGYYNLGDNTTTNRSTLVNVQINNSTNATNCMWMTSNQGHNSSHSSHAIYLYKSAWAGQVNENPGEWYYGGYDLGVHSTGHTDSYNNRQDRDPQRNTGNFRYKNNNYETYANKGNWHYTICGNSSSKSGLWADLKTGMVYLTSNNNLDNNYRAITLGTPAGRTSRALVMRRLRNSHM
jgi:alpha-tubulin suppressor-like RCC1 family protein